MHIADWTEKRQKKRLKNKKISQETIFYWPRENGTNLGKEKQNTTKRNSINYLTIADH